MKIEEIPDAALCMVRSLSGRIGATPDADMEGGFAKRCKLSFLASSTMLVLYILQGKASEKDLLERLGPVIVIVFGCVAIWALLYWVLHILFGLSLTKRVNFNVCFYLSMSVVNAWLLLGCLLYGTWECMPSTLASIGLIVVMPSVSIFFAYYTKGRLPWREAWASFVASGIWFMLLMTLATNLPPWILGTPKGK